MSSAKRLVALPLALALAAAVSLQGPPTRVLDATNHHLGNDNTPEWSEAPAAPEGKRLEIGFKAKKRAGEQQLPVLLLRPARRCW